jgi:ketosteroid isomerase-like protein
LPSPSKPIRSRWLVRDLAYGTGSYSMTMTGPDKEPATEMGHYVVVWRKGADGAWKVVDAPVSDPGRPAAK